MASDEQQGQAQDQQPDGWEAELTALLAEVEAARTPEAEARVFARLAALDPELLAFLVSRVSGEATPEAAAFLEMLAVNPRASAEVRASARAELGQLAERGVLPAAPGAELFHSGWAQQGRERGEQIMLLGWRVPSGHMEALVFLLDWRGDGLKDFYRTRDLSDEEWRALLEHNGQKGAPLVEITLGEGRALLEEALAEGRRFSRPVPREYKASQALLAERIMDAAALPAAQRGYVAPDLAPDAVVAAYVRALHHRDYALVWELLAPEHPARTAGSGQPAEPSAPAAPSAPAGARAAAIDALRQAWKHAPRRRPEVSATLESPLTEDSATASVLAAGESEAVERTGQRVRTPVRERYTLRRTPDGWRITAIQAV
ncbi:MAG TPA: hypothetical protein VIG30_12855 [Ktedonobacterales bacterium]